MGPIDFSGLWRAGIAIGVVIGLVIAGAIFGLMWLLDHVQIIWAQR